MKFAAGVDGCRAGWVFARVDDAAERPAIEIGILSPGDDQALLDLFCSATCVYVDMPMGLAGPGSVSEGFPERDCDRSARKVLRDLGGPPASIFPVPVRQAVFANSYEAACAANRQLCGRAFPLQTWNLVPKIRILDALLRRSPALSSRVFESHPELCFRALSPDGGSIPSKKSSAGVEARLTLLAGFLPGVAEVVDASLRSIRRRDLKRDDLLDALVLAAAARLAVDPTRAGRSGPRHLSLPRRPRIDGEGIPARIALPDTPRVWSCFIEFPD
jgi:predicted RNase H-like nuclease